MNTDVLVEFFLIQLKRFLQSMGDVSVNNIFLLPKGFDLEALLRKKGETFSLQELRTMISVLAEEANAKQLEDFMQGLAAAIKFLELKIDFEEEAAPSQGAGRQAPPAGGEGDEGGGSPRTDSGPALTEKMAKVAAVYQKAHPGPTDETPKEALTRSMNETGGPTPWAEELKRLDVRPFKIWSTDWNIFLAHPSMAAWKKKVKVTLRRKQHSSL